MLLLTAKRVDDGVELDINLSQVCFLGPVNIAKKGEKPSWDKETCVVAMTNGVVLHIKKSYEAVKTSMKSYRGN